MGCPQGFYDIADSRLVDNIFFSILFKIIKMSSPFSSWCYMPIWCWWLTYGTEKGNQKSTQHRQPPHPPQSKTMGSSQSKPLLPSPITTGKTKLDEITEQVAEHAAKLENLILDDTSSKHGRSLDSSIYSKWEDSLLAEPKNRLALSAFTQGDMLNVIRNRDALINDGLHLFSLKIEDEGKPVTNQRSSGRCWLFASTNVMRIAFMKKYRHSNLH